MTSIVLIAKPPIAGKAKTRLNPPLTLQQAADVAQALLLDSIEIVRRMPADRRILAWAGEELPEYASDFDLLRQVPGTLDQRLGAIFDACEGPTFLIGMDTPQIRACDVAAVFDPASDADAWFGPAVDGGFWGFGLRDPRGDLLRGVPMSTADTGRVQLQRLHAARLSVEVLPTLVDIDEYDDALHVASLVPESHVARRLQSIWVRPSAAVA